MKLDQPQENLKPMAFYGGIFGALLPFLVFITGVVTIALSGAPDERGFWPVLIFALALGLILCKNRTAFSEAVIFGMSQKIVMIKITAWILASIIGILMTQTGQEFDITSVSPLEVGLYNFMSWGLLLIGLATLLFGWGKTIKTKQDGK